MKKKKIAILGSTGSIGKSLLSLLRKDKNNKIILLSANKNYHQLIKQAKEFNVKNIIILDKGNYKKLKKDKKYRRFNIFNNYDCFKNIFKKKISIKNFLDQNPDVISIRSNLIKYTREYLTTNYTAKYIVNTSQNFYNPKK